MEADLELIGKFHGHVGPYVVLGYRMGQLASEQLGSSAFDKTVTVYTGTKPSLSCLIDGIQIGSGCTLGKGTVEVVDEKVAKAVFKGKVEGEVTITLKQEISDRIKEVFEAHTGEEYSEWIMNAGYDELFDIDVY